MRVLKKFQKTPSSPRQPPSYLAQKSKQISANIYFQDKLGYRTFSNNQLRQQSADDPAVPSPGGLHVLLFHVHHGAVLPRGSSRKGTIGHLVRIRVQFLRPSHVHHIAYLRKNSKTNISRRVKNCLSI